MTSPMSPQDLADFVAQVRAECDAALAPLDAVDPAMLPLDVRTLYEQQRARWHLVTGVDRRAVGLDRDRLGRTPVIRQT